MDDHGSATKIGQGQSGVGGLVGACVFGRSGRGLCLHSSAVRSGFLINGFSWCIKAA